MFSSKRGIAETGLSFSFLGYSVPLIACITNRFAVPMPLLSFIESLKSVISSYFKWFTPSSEDMDLATNLILSMVLIWYVKSKNRQIISDGKHQEIDQPEKKYISTVFILLKPTTNISTPPHSPTIQNIYSLKENLTKIYKRVLD